MTYDNDNEARVIEHLIDTMANHGWELCAVDDGGEERIETSDKHFAIETVISVEEAWLYFTKNGATHYVYIIPCNNPEECLVDYSYGQTPKDDFSYIMETQVYSFAAELAEE